MELLLGDCLELLKRVPDGSVDMILTDPPYGVTMYRWDREVPEEALWAEYRRIIKPVGVIAVFGLEPFLSRMRLAAVDLYKYDWVWVKNRATNFCHAKNMPMRKHEMIAVFSGGSIGHPSQVRERRVPYFPQGVRACEQEACGTRSKPDGIWKPKQSHKERYIRRGTGYPSTVLEFPKEEHCLTAVQKPVALLEYLIRTYTQPGELVLDSFMGVGSTGVACLNTGRDFIGMELNEEPYRAAVERIRRAELDRAAREEKTGEVKRDEHQPDSAD